MLAAIALQHDLGHMERTYQMVAADRRPAGILFADLEGSSRLARSLPTATYFALGRRLVRVADQCIIDASGLVGRHVGDGTWRLSGPVRIDVGDEGLQRGRGSRSTSRTWPSACWSSWLITVIRKP